MLLLSSLHHIMGGKWETTCTQHVSYFSGFFSASEVPTMCHVVAGGLATVRVVSERMVMKFDLIVPLCENYSRGTFITASSERTHKSSYTEHKIIPSASPPQQVQMENVENENENSSNKLWFTKINLIYIKTMRMRKKEILMKFIAWLDF